MVTMQTTAPGAPPGFSTAAAGDLFQRLALPLWISHHPQNVDVFRRLDAHILLGVMDARGISQPFFFTLRREGSDVASRASSLPKI